MRFLMLLIIKDFVITQFMKYQRLLLYCGNKNRASLFRKRNFEKLKIKKHKNSWSITIFCK